ncbi:MAG: hypothetical protein R2942_05480 [Ignavibacteria bacterium]
MKKIVECVPNISEGRDEKIINACADAVRKVSGVTLLDVDPGSQPTELFLLLWEIRNLW